MNNVQNSSSRLMESPKLKKVLIFLSVTGPSLYSLICSLCTPDAPNTVAFDVLVQKLNDHFLPKPLEILCWFKFNKRDQRKGETISDFMAEVRKLSENCNFGIQLNSMLWNRPVCGIFDEEIQRKLLSTNCNGYCFGRCLLQSKLLKFVEHFPAVITHEYYETKNVKYGYDQRHTAQSVGIHYFFSLSIF